MPPKPLAKDLNLFHGDDLYDNDALKQRMASLTGRNIAAEELGEVENAFTYDGDDLQEGLTGPYGPQALRHCIFTTLVGYDFESTLNRATNAVVIVHTSTQKRIAGAALLGNDWYFQRDPQTGELRRYPQVCVRAFGVDSPQENDALEPSVLAAIVSEVRAYAANNAILLQPVYGTREQHTFVPTVSLHPLAQMKPTLPAKAINACLGDVTARLKDVIQGTPTMYTGFGDRIEGLRAALDTLQRQHPNHPVAQAITGCASLRGLSMLSLTGSEASYQQTQCVARATHTLLKALRFGINTFGDTLHPETCGNKLVTTTVVSESDDGGIALRILYKGSNVGTVSLTSQNLDDGSPMFDFNHTPIDGLVSDTAGAILSRALNGSLFRALVKRRE